MRPQQKAQANGQTETGPQEEIKVTKEKKKPAPAQPPADTKVGPPSIHTGFVEEVYLCLYICSNNNCGATKAFLVQLRCILIAVVCFSENKTV